jgi:2-dehydropantoate 2-reductase
MSSTSSILIVGTGALACLFAARFSAVGIPVTMLGTWQEGIDVLRSQGVCLVDGEGSKHFYKVRVVTDPEECLDVELALALVKSWQTERAASQLQSCLSAQGQVLTLQNGLGNREKLGHVLGIDRVFQGITTLGGTLLGPGLVRSGGDGFISIEAHPKLARLSEFFQQAHFAVQKTVEIEPLIWGKLAVNAAINPLTAILDVPNGDLLKSRSSKKLMGLAAIEVEKVAKATGIHLPFDDVVEAVEEVVQRTARNYSSMLQDMRRGAPTEIEAINAAVVRTADRVGKSAPVNQTLYLIVKSMLDPHSKMSVSR